MYSEQLCILLLLNSGRMRIACLLFKDKATMIFLYIPQAQIPNPPSKIEKRVLSIGNRQSKIGNFSKPVKATPAKSAEVENAITTITVRANAEVNGAHFTLGEIAEFDGKDKALLETLSKVEIGASPLPGMSRPLFPGDITVHLRAAHQGSLLDSKRLEVVAPSEMRVTRFGHDISMDEITKVALAAAQVAVKDVPNTTLEAVAPVGKVTLPSGKFRVIAGALRGQPENGNIVVPVSLLVDGRIVQTADVTVRVQRKMMVVVASRTLEPHDVLEAQDAQLLLVDLPPGFVKPMIHMEDVIGKRVTRRIMADAPISAAVLETPPDIAANARLTIEYVYGSIHITAPGMARQAGKIGDTIRVYALDTHKELEAVIVDARTVQLQEAE